jgi:hypothetical protein
MIAKIGYGQLCLKEENLCFNNKNILQLYVKVEYKHTDDHD